MCTSIDTVTMKSHLIVSELEQFTQKEVTCHPRDISVVQNAVGSQPCYVHKSIQKFSSKT